MEKLSKMPTKFQNKVYQICKKVPKGKVTTYKAIAKAMGSKAYRAVGSALNKNPNPLYKCKGKQMVPCHRIINTNGFVGQFAKGINTKIKLLASEGIEVSKDKKINLKKYLLKFK